MVGGSPSNRVPDRCAEAGVWACVQPSGARVPRPRRGGTRRHDPSLPQSRVTGPASAPIANDRGPPIASTRKPRFPSPPAAAHRGRHAAPRPPDVRRARCAGQRTRMDVESEESDGAASAAVLRARRRSLRRRRRARFRTTSGLGIARCISTACSRYWPALRFRCSRRRPRSRSACRVATPRSRRRSHFSCRCKPSSARSRITTRC